MADAHECAADGALATARTALSPLRGLMAAVLCALGGVAIALAFLGVFSWLRSDTPGFDLNYNIRHLAHDATGFFGHFAHATVGIAVVCGSAGWATFAPQGRFRLAKSLAIVFALCLPGWTLLYNVVPMPRRLMSNETILYPAELLALIAPPVGAAGLLTWYRAWCLRNPPRSEGDTPSLAECSDRKN